MRYFHLLPLAATCVVAQTPGQASGAGDTGPGGLTANPGGEYNRSMVGTDLTTNQTYSNPIMTVNAGDPFMTQYDDYYLFTFSTNDNITIKRSHNLTADWDYAETKVVFTPNATAGCPWCTDLWAPEIHSIGDKWYIIFTATPDFDNPLPLLDAMCPFVKVMGGKVLRDSMKHYAMPRDLPHSTSRPETLADPSIDHFRFACPAINHRMFVLESSGSDPWESDYSMKGELNTFDQFAIDGTYFKYRDELYHIYSCWENKYSGWPANLCITHMSNPWTVDSSLLERRILSVPNNPWEQVPYGRPGRLATNEGPQQLVNPQTGQNFVLYSAARVNTPFYCIGMLELVGDDPDPMQYTSWKKHNENCVFHQNPNQKVYGTGHASYTSSPDGSESYIVYHAMTTDNPSPDLYRTTRTQKFSWNGNGEPVFPAAANGPFPVPS